MYYIQNFWFLHKHFFIDPQRPNSGSATELKTFVNVAKKLTDQQFNLQKNTDHF